jgi:hypothetical protein
VGKLCLLSVLGTTRRGGGGPMGGPSPLPHAAAWVGGAWTSVFTAKSGNFATRNFATILPQFCQGCLEKGPGKKTGQLPGNWPSCAHSAHQTPCGGVQSFILTLLYAPCPLRRSPVCLLTLVMTAGPRPRAGSANPGQGARPTQSRRTSKLHLTKLMAGQCGISASIAI